MARTRDEQGRRILEAASELLSKEGASALSVRRIASAAGCQLAATLHQANAYAAYLGAIDVGGNAMGQAGHVLLLQATGGAAKQQYIKLFEEIINAIKIP